jgi:uncharacterized protein YciI
MIPQAISRTRCVIISATMANQHFFIKLIPPRSTFPADITDAERGLMAAHSDYCQRQFNAGKLLVYGPVMSPDGAFGMGILEVADEAEARQFGGNDPSVVGGLNRFEIYPMRVPNARAKAEPS